MSLSASPIFNAEHELAVERITRSAEEFTGRWTLATSASDPESVRYFKLEDILHSVKYHPQQFHPNLVELLTNGLDLLKE